jgi:hypothetical protein
MAVAATAGQCVGGLYDVLIGVPDLVEAIAYWECYGYRVGRSGDFDAALGRALYGVDSGGAALRLYHQDADHGLVRLVQWQRPSGTGLGMSPFKVRGGRWSAAEVAQVGRIAAHAKYAQIAGRDISIFHADTLPAPDTARDPFRRTLGGAFEMALLQPLWRQVLFERADFPSPLYGSVNTHCLLQGSQFTHCCVVTQGVPDAAWSFYDACLGLKRSGDFKLGWSEIGTSGKDILRLDPGEGFRMVRFDDPRSEEGAGKRSGRMIFFDFASDRPLPDARAASRPGVLGYSQYSWRVNDVEHARERALAAGANRVTAVLTNELGERSFTCDAPDGTSWAFVDACDALPVRG